MVLLAAEVVGICYYELLAATLPDGGLTSVLREIAADERAHLRFHCDFLRAQVRTHAHRRIFVVTWRALMVAAAIAVLVDHRAALRDLGIAPGAVWRRWWTCSHNAEARIVSCDGRPEPAYAR